MRISWRKRLSRAIRGRLRARVLSNHGEGILANTKNGLLIVDPRDFNVSRALLTRGSYDWKEVQWISRILNQSSPVVFVGAHIGALLVPLALASGTRDIVAFEPSPQNHRLLKMNVALNGLDGISIHCIAAGDLEGAARFAQNPVNSGNSRICDTGQMEVQVRRLDTLLAHMPHIDLLVVDTEGFEVRAMQGGLETLAKTDYFYVEYAPEQLREQGSNPNDFIELAAERFSSMYLPGDPVRFFPQRTYVRYLKELPLRRGLLLNLLFSNEPAARPELSG